MEIKVETTVRIAVELIVAIFCFRSPYLILLIPLIDFSVNILLLWIYTTLFKIGSRWEFEESLEKARLSAVGEALPLDPRRN